MPAHATLAPRLRLYEHRVGGWIVVGVSGDLTAATAGHVAVRLRTVARRLPAAVAVDVSAAAAEPGLDLAPLVAAGRAVIAAGRPFALVGAAAREAAAADADVVHAGTLAELPPVAAPRFAR